MPRTTSNRNATILNIKKQNVTNMLTGAANRQRGIGCAIPVNLYCPMISMLDDDTNFDLLTPFQSDRIIDKLIQIT